MAKDCNIDYMTVDATVHTSIVAAKDFKGNVIYVPYDYRTPTPNNVYCGSCGNYLFPEGNNHTDDEINKAVKEHLEK